MMTHGGIAGKANGPFVSKKKTHGKLIANFEYHSLPPKSILDN
jgi:hypothetical protein